MRTGGFDRDLTDMPCPEPCAQQRSKESKQERSSDGTRTKLKRIVVGNTRPSNEAAGLLLHARNPQRRLIAANTITLSNQRDKPVALRWSQRAVDQATSDKQTNFGGDLIA